MKQQMIAAVLAASFALPAFAQGTDSFEAQVFDTQPEKVKVEELSQREMRETEGAFTLQSMSIGAGLNTGSYLLLSDNRSFQGAVAAAGVGALTGGAIKVATSGGHYNLAAANFLTNQLFQAFNRQKDYLDGL